MHTQRSVFVLAAAIVVGALVIALSPLLWTDHFIGANVTTISKPLPAGCSIVSEPAGAGAIIVAHCPSWVQLS